MLITYLNLFPNQDFLTEFAIDITNYVYRKVILMVPEGSLLMCFTEMC